MKSESEVTQFCLTLCDPWTVVGQAPLSMGFSREEYWSGLPFASPEDLPEPGIEPRSPTLQADSLPSEPPGNLLAIWEEDFSVQSLFIFRFLKNLPSKPFIKLRFRM